MASEVEICNRALQKLGAGRITALTEDSEPARHCNVAYAPLRDAELRAHPWNFAVKRLQIAADATAPAFGYDNAFTLPSDCLRVLRTADNAAWKIEGGKILTDDDAPLDLRYTRQETDPNVFDTLFREALATRLALELCEPITQSNTKKEALREDYKQIIREARRTDAIEDTPDEEPQDDWLTARL